MNDNFKNVCYNNIYEFINEGCKLEAVKISVREVEKYSYEYIINNRLGIVIGRAYTIDTQDNKFCLLRLKIYNEKNYCYLGDILNLFCINFFKESNFLKLNILVDEKIETSPFVRFGFLLEGMIKDNIQSSDSTRCELNFGVNINSYRDDNKFINVIKLMGENVNLKILTPENAKDIHDFYLENKNHLKKFEPKREQDFYEIESHRKNLIESYINYLNGISLNFGIFLKDEFVGKIKISNIVRGVFKNANVGYAMALKHEGKGYMTESLKLVIEYASTDLDIHRIEASTLTDNLKSQKVLLNNGFKELGINEKYLLIDGTWRDHTTFYKIF